jgi:hypothetical protein
MDLLGTIEPGDGTTAERNAWVALIPAHSSLASVTPRQGVNPFTRKPLKFEAPADSARILLDGMDVGAAHWAEDGSDRLVVWSEPAAKTRVALIAQDIAARLGMRFIPDGGLSA